MQERRLSQLDSLRGIAALIVVFFHALLITVFRENGNSQTKQVLDKLFNHTPLVVFNSGHQSVILFFVLSGFVLYLPFSKTDNFKYIGYIVKRFCRLYFPYILSVLFGFLMLRLLIANGITPVWGTPITPGIVLHHIFLIGMFSQKTFNPVIWSLVQEMRISLLLPFIYFFVKNQNWRTVLFNGMLLSLIGMTLHSIYDDVDVFTNFFDTLHYTLMFIVGALLAKHMTEIKTYVANMTVWSKLIIVAAAFFVYGYPSIFTNQIGGNARFQLLLQDWFITLGCAVFIVSALASGFVSKILNGRILLFFGKISYSIYLSHLVLLYTWISLAPGWGLTRTEIWLYFLTCTFLLSSISYVVIEKPSIRLGRYLSDVIEVRSKKTQRELNSTKSNTTEI